MMICMYTQCLTGFLSKSSIFTQWSLSVVVVVVGKWSGLFAKKNRGPRDGRKQNTRRRRFDAVYAKSVEEGGGLVVSRVFVASCRWKKVASSSACSAAAG